MKEFWHANISNCENATVCRENGEIVAAEIASDDDARLIAAAPQMLEALEMVVAWDDDPIGNALDIGAIKEAIKAAKGEI